MMKKTIILAGLVVLASLLMSDWDPGDGYKMHFPQEPDPNGWDVAVWCDYISLADDWQCTETGPVEDIHIWISWEGDVIGDVSAIGISIYSDMPAPGQYGYSQPDEYLWGNYFWSTGYTVRGPYYGDQGWFDPVQNQANRPDHQQYFQINIENIADPFIQTEGTIYWLDVCINPYGVGWKTTQNPWNDTAVYWNNDLLRWSQIIVPDPYNEPLDLAFVIGGEPPTPVELSSFTAFYHDGTPTLNWTTQSESNNIGWNVYRSNNDNLNESFQVNSSLISGAGTSFEPTEYTFSDENDVETNSTYFYWIENRDASGNTNTHGPISLTIPSNENENPDAPDMEIYSINNYPNPFSNNTEIGFTMKEEGNLEVTIYNSKGQMIRTLYKGHFSQQDFNTVWDGKDSNGKKVSSGIYMYVIKTDENTYSRKMILTK